MGTDARILQISLITLSLLMIACAIQMAVTG